MLNHQTNEDLKAFERRLTEIIACYQPQTKRWRILLILATLSTSVTAFQWLSDPRTERVTFIQSLNNHKFFTFNCLALLILFVLGIHRRVVAPAIIVSRIKLVLENFNLSCDHDGRLILKRSSNSSAVSGSSTGTTSFETNSTSQNINKPFHNLASAWY